MKLEIGKLYQNKTFTYLVPALLFYGEDFRQRVNTLHVTAFGIGDSLVEGSPVLIGRQPIFILVDKFFSQQNFIHYQKWLRFQDFYISDYSYDNPEYENARYHMFVIQFPYLLTDAYRCFFQGKYSKMYLKEEIQKYFQKDYHQKAIATMSRSPHLFPDFKTELEKIVGPTDLNYQEFRKLGLECEIPPLLEEEVFNFKEVGKVFL